MGWWGTDVMSGDASLDWLGWIADEMGAKSLYDENGDSGLSGYLSGYDFTKIRVQLNIGRVFRKISEKGFGSDEWDRQIALQVLGVIIMETGSPISDGVRIEIIHAARFDEWGTEIGEKDSGKRCQDMAIFANMIQTYDGKTPMPYESVGLLDKIAEVLS